MLAASYPELLAKLKEAEMAELAAAHVPEELDDAPEAKAFRFKVKQKKINSIIRKALEDAGYGDAIKQLSLVRE